jgi:DNA repair protein RadC
MSRVGSAPLGDAELLAVVLGHGGSGRTASDIAQAVLIEVGGLPALTRVSSRRLARVAGIGVAQASRILAAVELGRRTLSAPPDTRTPIRSASDVAEFLLPRFGAHPVERFGVVLLDTRHRMMGVHLVSEGTLDATVALPREVFREAAIAGAAAVLLFHTHPSGDPHPSVEDVAVTKRLAAAGRIVGIDVLDHLILADARYCSLRKSRTIEW